MIIKDVIAYHHTSKENADLIKQKGFDDKCFKKFSLGYGVQCFLNDLGYAPFEGKTDGQIKVSFENCRVFNDKTYINKSLERIREADTKYQKQIAKDEAEKIKLNGYNAYEVTCLGKDCIVFLDYPNFLEWIKF